MKGLFHISWSLKRCALYSLEYYSTFKQMWSWLYNEIDEYGSLISFDEHLFPFFPGHHISHSSCYSFPPNIMIHAQVFPFKTNMAWFFLETLYFKWAFWKDQKTKTNKKNLWGPFNQARVVKFQVVRMILSSIYHD